MLTRAGRDQSGTAAVEFAVAFPLLFLLTVGILEFTLAYFDYHRASEAARRAGRTAAIMEPIANLDTLDNGNSVTCTGSGENVSCSGGAVENLSTYTEMVNDVQDIFPALAGSNLQIIYSPTGVGDIETPGGLKPEVTVNLINVQHDFLILGALIGINDVVLPAASTSVLANGYSTF